MLIIIIYSACAVYFWMLKSEFYADVQMVGLSGSKINVSRT